MASQLRNPRVKTNLLFALPARAGLIALAAIFVFVIRAGAQQVASSAPVPTSAPAPPPAGAATELSSPFLTPPAESELPAAQAGRTGDDDRSIPAKVLRYAERLVNRYDANGDRRLDQAEWGRIQGDPRAADANRDGLMTLDELAQYMADYGRRRRIRLISPLVDEAKEYPSLLNPTTAAETPPKGDQNAASQESAATENAGPVAAEATSSSSGQRKKATKFYVPGSRLTGLPDWFAARDADGDGQLSQAEFAPEASKQDLDQFARYDRNGDGLLTTEECLRGPGR